MRAVGTLMPNGPTRKVPAPLSSRVPNTLGESKLGTHSHPTPPSGATSALVWQFERNAYASMVGNGDGIAALWGSAAALGCPSPPVVTALTGPPTGHASCRGRPRACPPRPDPRIPARRGGREAESRAAAA